MAIPLSQWAEWSDDDRGWALAWLGYEAGRCPNCRGWLAETTNPANEYAYHADAPVICHRCVALDAEQERMKDHPKRSALVLWPVKLRRRRG